MKSRTHISSSLFIPENTIVYVTLYCNA